MRQRHLRRSRRAELPGMVGAVAMRERIDSGRGDGPRPLPLREPVVVRAERHAGPFATQATKDARLVQPLAFGRPGRDLKRRDAAAIWQDKLGRTEHAAERFDAERAKPPRENSNSDLSSLPLDSIVISDRSRLSYPRTIVLAESQRRDCPSGRDRPKLPEDLLESTALVEPGHQFRGVMHPNGLHQARPVGLYRSARKAQLGGHLLIGESLPHKHQDSALPTG